MREKEMVLCLTYFEASALHLFIYFLPTLFDPLLKGNLLLVTQ